MTLAPIAQPGTDCCAESPRSVGFNYGGIEFDFEGPDELLDCMARVGKTVPGADAPEALRRTPVLSVVRCRLNLKPSLGPNPLAPEERGWLNWTWHSGEAQVSTREAEAKVYRRGSGYAAEAWLPPSYRAAQTLMGALGSVTLHNLGGVILHASSVLAEDGGVMAFIGPSGAGKSTASKHLLGDSVRLFSVDRLALAPMAKLTGNEDPAVSHRWHAYPLPGGTAPASEPPRATPHWAPVRGIFRVHQAATGARLENCPPIRATAILRESAFHASSRSGEELELLARLEQLAAAVPVARLHFSLGTSLRAPLCRWLSAGGGR